MTRARATFAALPAAALLGLSLATSAWGAEGRSLRRGYAEFGSTGFTASGEESYWQGGLRVSSLDTRAPSVDLAFGALLVPAAIITFDLDLAWPVAMSPSTRLVPRVGGSALVIGGPGIGGAALGGNAGLGLVLAANQPVSFRVDYTIRRFALEELSDDGNLQTVSVGLSW